MNKFRTTPLFLLAALCTLFTFATCVDINSPPEINGIGGGIIKEGLPTRSVLEKFALFEFFDMKLPGASGISHSTDKWISPEYGETYDILTISFRGTTETVEAITEYFSTEKGWIEDKDHSGAGEVAFFRGFNFRTDVTFDTSDAPEYNIYISRETGLKIFSDWPDIGIAEQFKILGMEKPDGAKYVTHITKTNGVDDDLHISFIKDGNASDVLPDLLGIFSDDENNWTNTSDPNTSIYSFVKATYRAEINASQAPYYEITVNKEGDIEGIEGWPTEGTLDKYGMYEFYEKPDGATAIYHRTFKETSADGLSYDILEIRFNDVTGTAKDVITKYFTSWFLYTDGTPTPGVTQYTRGFASVSYSFPDTSNDEDIEYTLSIAKDSSLVIEENWPDIKVRREFGVYDLTEPLGIRHVTYSVEDGMLCIRFLGTTSTEGTLKTHFSDDAKGWEVVGFDIATGTYSYFNENTVAWVEFVTGNGSFYEIRIDRTMEGVPGWPKDELLKGFGLGGLSEPPQAEEIFHSVPEAGQLTIQFTTEADKSAVASYFVGWNTEFLDEVYEYSRGYTYVRFIVSAAPYYTIEASCTPEGDPGWPEPDELKPYELTGLAKPAGAENIYRWTEDDTNSTAITITFQGTNVAAPIVKYFTDNNWTRILQSTDENGNIIATYDSNDYHYSRGPAYVNFDARDPYLYTIFASMAFEGFPEWPEPAILHLYGIHGLNQPSGATNVNHETDNDSLTVRFFGETVSENAILGYFANWERITGTTDEQTGITVTFPSNEYHYQRGIAYVVFYTSEKPYYELSASRSVGEKAGWPSEADLKRYGLPDLLTRSINIAEPSYTSYTINDVENSLTIIFIDAVPGSNAGKTALDNYFNITHWNLEGSANGVSEYTRGIASVVFDTSGNGNYELQITRDVEGWTEAWPGSITLNEFGLQGLALPEAAATYSYNNTGTDELLLRFYGTEATKTAVLKYFAATNNWTQIEETTDESGITVTLDLIDGPFHYQRGIAYVVFSTSESPYYEIAASRNLEGNIGWPFAELLSQYGLQGLNQPAGVETGITLRYLVEDNELYMRFYGSTTTTEQGVKNYFATNNWTQIEEITDESGNTVKLNMTTGPEFHYQRGIAYVVFDVSERPYYDIATFRSIEGTTGWASSTLLGSFGLQGLGQPAGANNIMHFLDQDDDDLAIRFYGTSANQSEILAYFATTNGWAKPKDDNGNTIVDPAGEYHFQRGIAYVVFYTSGNPYFEIVASRDTQGTPEWPGDTLLKNYGLHQLPMPTGASTYSHFVNEEEDLVIRFYGTSTANDPAESSIRAYFNNGTWAPGAATLFTTEFSRGIASVVFDTAGKPYYELYVSRDLEGTPNWPTNAPPEKLLDTYGITGISWPSSSSLMHVLHFEEDDALIIRFYGGATDQNAMRAYFDTNWTSVGSLDGVYDYTRGIAHAVFDTSADPFYELYISVENPGIPGWPGETLRTKYGISDITWPSNAYNITHNEESGIDESGESYGGLVIRFYGEGTDAAIISTYLRGWALAESSQDSYYRGIAYLTFDTTSPPYYEIYVSIDENVELGWPRREGLESFGLHGMAAIILPDAESVSHIFDDDDLTISYGASNGSVIKSYFTNVNNHWKKETNDADGVPLGTGVSRYTRGIADVTIDDNAHTLSAYRYLEEGFATGWPLPAVLNTNGLFGMIQPAGISQITTWYKAGTETDTDGNEYATFTIRFYGTDAVTEGGLLEYFGLNGWLNETPASNDPNYEPGVYIYSRGTAYVIFDTSEKPYFEISVSLEAGGTTGWPQATLLDSFGLAGISLPNRPDMNITHVYDYANSGNELEMMFYGLGTDITAIRNYFSAAANWTDLTPQSTVTTEYVYSRGITNVTINTSGSPIYTIYITRDVDDLALGWPSAALRQEYGLSDLPFPSSAPNAYVWHGVNPDSKALEIHFFAAAGLDENTVLAYFSIGKNWIEQDSTDGSHSYYRDLSDAEFDPTEKPYYRIEVLKGDPGTSGWPNANILNQYGLFGMTATAPTGAVAGTIYYNAVYEVGSDYVEDNLTIRFNGTAATASAMYTYFTGNNWSVNAEQSSSTVTYYNAKGVAESVIFDASLAPSYTIKVERNREDMGNWPVDNWPTAAKLEEYGLYGLPAKPAAATLIWYDEEKDDDSDMLSIRFYGPTTGTTRANFETSVRNLFPTAATATGGGWTAETASTAGTYVYSRGIAYVTFDPTGWPYYEIQVSRAAGTKTGWPTAAILQKHGISGLNMPLNSTFVYYVDGGDQLTITFHHATAATVNTARTTYFSAINGWTADTATGSVYPYSKGSIGVEFDSSKTYFHVITTEQVGEPGLPGGTTLADFMVGGLTQAAMTSAGVVAGSIRHSAETSNLVLTFEGPAANQTVFEDAIRALLVSNGWVYDALANNVHSYYRSENTTSFLEFTVGSRPYYKIEVDK